MSGESTGLPDVRRPECHIAFSSSTTTLPSEGSSEGSLSLLAWKCVVKLWMAWTRYKTKELKPDPIIMDLSMARMNGLDGARE